MAHQRAEFIGFKFQFENILPTIFIKYRNFWSIPCENLSRREPKEKALKRLLVDIFKMRLVANLEAGVNVNFRRSDKKEVLIATVDRRILDPDSFYGKLLNPESAGNHFDYNQPVSFYMPSLLGRITAFGFGNGKDLVKIHDIPFDLKTFDPDALGLAFAKQSKIKKLSRNFIFC